LKAKRRIQPTEKWVVADQRLDGSGFEDKEIVDPV
jgi:hypothetical protein